MVGDAPHRNPGSLEAALGTLQFRCEILGEQSFSGDWRLDIPAGRTAVYLISEGSGWLAPDGHSASTFSEKDIVFNLGGASLRFGESIGHFADCASSHGADPSPFGGVRIATVQIQLTSPMRHPLLDRLPLLAKVPPGYADGGTTLGRLASCVISESRATTPAVALIQDRLAAAMILEALRVTLSSNGDIRSGWLEALADPEIGPVLDAMLRAPERDWSVASLAEHGSMSRSTFARRFQSLLRCGPMDCLVDIRMRKASELLALRDVDLKSVARSIGYRSTAAFSASFKRWCGLTPSEFRRTQ
jgi:AraC-like DNA-binding protein